MSFYLRFDLFDRSTSPESNCQNFENLKISCTHFGRSNLWIGDMDGIVYKYDKDFNSAIFIAYKTRVFHIHQCKDKDILITCGVDSSTSEIIKLWDFSKWNKQNIPIILRTISSLNSSDIDFKVVCFNVLNSLNAMVLGLGNGKIDLIYSDVLNQRKSKRKQIYNLTENITTVAINEINDQLYVFLTTINRIMILAFNEQTNEIKVTLDVEEGKCPKNCSVLVDNVFVVANEKGIYEVYLDYLGPCRALDGDNISLHLYKHYLILVKLVKPSVLSGTHMMQRSSSTLNYQIVIFDHVNRFIACEFPLQDFNFLFIEWGSIYVHCGPPTNKIYVFTEKDIQRKLNIFFQKNSFKLAIEIAKSQNYDADALTEMFHKYGDHLYNMKNYDESIQQYIKTIGKLEPSFVIYKFMKTPLIPNLVKYMEALVKEENSTAEHHALLLNCYIILKDQRNLMDFIKNHKLMNFEKSEIDKALNLLRKVKLLPEALELAQKYKEHDWYLKILIEDLKEYNKAIEYISLLPLKETEKALLNYGNTLINVEPEIFAKQLEIVCNQQTDSKLNIATILNVFVNNRKGLKHFLKRYISKIISIEENYSIYVDTLIELLLYEVEKESENSDQSAAEVMNILQNENLQYHKSKALVCCQMRGFTKGYRYLCQSQEKYLEILNSFKAENNIDGIINTCNSFGSREPALWINALEYLIEVKADERYFKDVISEIEEYELISPLLLLEKMTMSSHSLQFGLVKDFVLRYYEKNEKLINQYQNEISKLQDETKKNNETILCLNTEVQVFQNLKCMMCHNILDIPSVHFLCNHSYHLKCFEMFTDAKDKCPNCAPKIDEMLTEINQWKSNKLNSLTDVDSLSLDHLWRNILDNSHHPVTIDPDQFLADAMAKSILNSDSLKKSHSLNDSKTSKTSDKFSQKEPNPAPIKDISTPVQNFASAEIKISNMKKIYSAEKLSNQSPDRSSPLMRKGSPQVNPKEKPNETKRSIPISKNPFDGDNFKGSSNSKDYPDSLNPFE